MLKKLHQKIMGLNERQDLLKSKIYLIAIAVVVWASYCAYLVKTNIEVMSTMALPVETPPIFIYDLMWLTAYITLLVGLQITAVKGVGVKRSWTVIVAVLLTGVTQVLMYYVYYELNTMTLALIFNSWNTAAILTVFVGCWAISRLGALLTLPYVFLSGFSLYLAYYMVLLN